MKEKASVARNVMAEIRRQRTRRERTPAFCAHRINKAGFTGRTSLKPATPVTKQLWALSFKARIIKGSRALA
jgi:hypothetical protein